jgi:WD repeat-containing protein 26
MVSQVDLEDFPQQLDLLAEDITTFLDCLNEFPEFNDEAVNVCINSFASDLKVRSMSCGRWMSCNIFEQYWSSCLAEYHGAWCESIVDIDLQRL